MTLFYILKGRFHKMLKWIKTFIGKNNIKEQKSIDIEEINASTYSYTNDIDTIIFDREELAQKIGKCMLDLGLINFETESKLDRAGTVIYETHAKAYAGKFNIY